MPGFKIHITASTILGVGYGVGGALFYDVPLPTAALATTLCSVSGMLPDLDSGPGRPMHESICFAAAAVPMAMADRFRHMGWTHETIILLGAATYLFIRFVLYNMLKHMTVHRGIFHSFPVMFIFAQLAFLICSTGDLTMRYYKAGAIVVGFFSHLLLDEIWSIDFRHFRLKSSFGTAIKFWADSRWATCVAYLILAVTTLATLYDPIWATAGSEEQELHNVASRLIDSWR